MRDLKNVVNFASIMANKKRTLTDTGIIAGVFVVLYVLIYFVCAPGLCFLETTATYIGYGPGNTSMIFSPGGCARLLASWLQQWLVTPVVASLVLGSLLTAVTLSFGLVMSRLSGRHSLMPLAIIPAVTLIAAHTDIDYRLVSTVAVAMVAIALVAVAATGNPWIRLAVSLAGCALVWMLAGPAAMLFAAAAVLVSIALDGKRGLFSLLCLPLACGLAYYGYAGGLWSSPQMAMLPRGYYPHWHHAGFTDLLPWIAAISIIAMAAIAGHLIPATALRRMKSWQRLAFTGIIATGAAGCLVYYAGHSLTGSFAVMWLHTSANEWDEIVAEYNDADKEDATMQNFLNLALAEKGILCDQLFWYPAKGVASLHNTEWKSPYNYMLLSRVYYSMGFVALAKRYAFEANEALGNASPQMLMLLADTNIITGDYDVAKKYLDILALTTGYSGWAQDRKRLLYNDSAVAADPVLGMKRKCIFPDDRFAGSKGIADDMLQVLRANPSHASTMQYLGAYYMLSRHIPGLISLIDEFQGTPALRNPLPIHFQEAVVIDGIINGNGIVTRYNIHPSVLERCRAFWAEHKPQPNTLWHYLRQR